MTPPRSSLAWVFPGQGSQAVGMGRAAAEREPAVAAVFAEADQALGYPLSQLIFVGPAEQLQSTAIQQPAIVATSIAMLVGLERAGRLTPPLAVAGHSLGQYSALVAAGALTLADALRLVAERGRLMQHHGAGAMAAVLNLTTAQVAEVAATAGVELANVNAPGQVTLSGRTEAIEQAMAVAQARGARRVVRLPVSAAFHSSLMQPVVAGLAPLVEAVPLTAPTVPLLSNVDARPLTTPTALRQELLDHICAPVQWVATVEALMSMGATAYLEVGPGRVLSGLIRRIHRAAELTEAETLLG
jgi:[acyl-carrier-protein] S-malonyltransferase